MTILELASHSEKEFLKYHLYMIHKNGYTIIESLKGSDLLCSLMSFFNISLTQYYGYKYNGKEYIKLVKSI